MLPMQLLANQISKKIINLSKISLLIKMSPHNKMKNKIHHKNPIMYKKIKELTLIDSKMQPYICSSLRSQILMIRFTKIKFLPNRISL